MTLANIAILLARSGKKVLVVDFDLEAPGLWRFFEDLKPGLRNCEGMLEMLTVQTAQAVRTPIDWRRYTCPIEFEGKSFSFITSGKQDQSYPNRLRQFTWHELYENDGKGMFIERLRRDWTREYDITLIDSRTGITDTGGVCTIALPDMIVPIFVPNQQTIEGTFDILNIAQQRRQDFTYDRPPALVLPVLSRFDSRTEYEIAQYWLDLVARKFEKYYADWLPAEIPARHMLERTKLPYVAYFSFGERLAVLREGISDPESLGYALNTLAQLIETELAAAPAVVGASLAGSGSGEQTWIKPLVTMRLLGGISPRNDNFTGRHELLRNLREALADQARSGVALLALHGLGGIGKTQLAIEYVHRFMSGYELIWWIASDHMSSVRRSLVALAKRLNLPETQDMDFAVQAVLDELALGRSYSNWLLVFDNADDTYEIRRYFPSGGYGHILVTSRNRDWSNKATVLEVQAFGEEESIDLLTGRWTGLSDEDARSLAQDLGNLPLALDQAVALHQITGIPASEYLELLRTHLTLLLDEDTSGDYPLSLARTCRVAFGRLRERSPDAAELLEICSFLGPSDIAIPMLIRGCQAPLPPEVRSLLSDNIRLRGAIREIGRHGLAELDVRNDSLKIHTLVGRLLQDVPRPEQREVAKRSAQQLLAAASPEEPGRSSWWNEYAQISPHIVPSGIISSAESQDRQVVVDQIRFLFVVGDYRESAKLAQLVVTEWLNNRGEDRLTLLAEFHFANALRGEGEYERARNITEDAFSSAERALGSDDELTLRVANSRAADLRLLGRFAQALEADSDTFGRYQAIFGEDHPATLRSANNLAVDYRLLADFATAQRINEDTLWRRQAHRSDHKSEVLASLNNQVRGLYDLGRYTAALALARQCVTDYGPLLPHHPLLYLARRNSAILERVAGNAQRSVELARSVLEQTVDRLGKQHEHSLAALMTLANSLNGVGVRSEARVLAEEAYSSYGELFGSGHPFTLASGINLAIIARALGDLDGSDALSAATADGLLHALPRHHFYAICSGCGQGNSLSLRGRLEAARDMSAKVYARAKRALGRDHPLTLLLACNHACNLDATGAAKEATALRATAVAGLRESLGPEHQLTARAELGDRFELEIEVPAT